MSTSPQYILQSQDVYTFTLNLLNTLPLKMPGTIESRDLLRVLVFAAASRLSVHQACEQLERAPSGPTVLGHLARQFSDLDALEGHLNNLLARLLPKGLGKRGHRVVSWDHHTGLMREVRPYEILDNEPQKVRKMPHEKA